MTRNPIIGPTRRSMRLRGYDYARAGAYFVTVCAFKKNCIFGDIVGGAMQPNDLGSIALDAWDDIPNHAPNVELDAFVLMPNHLHAVILIDTPNELSGDHGVRLVPDPVGIARRGSARFAESATPRGPASGSLGAIVGSFKAATTRRFNALNNTPGVTLWQRDFYDHIIRDGSALDRIRRYIAANPSRWLQDDDHPANHRRRR